MSAPLLTPLVVGLLIALGQAAQQDSGIVNGREAEPHSRPYMALVLGNEHACGGFLVSDSFVLTAAHCLKWGEDLTVLLGVHDIYENQKLIWAEVKFYHFHPGYNNDTLENDIGLLQLKNAVEKTKEVKWIPLPEKDEDIEPNTLCSVAGWGANKTNGTFSPRLMEVNVSVVDRAECQEMWNVSITNRMMCAGGSNDNKGACNGDSGGPLVCNDTAVGIVSFGDRNCSTPEAPNVYTKISKYLPWVECIISSIK